MPAKRKVRRSQPKSPKPLRVRERQGNPRWVSRVMLDAIHDAQIREHGGSAGVRDDGLLESALARPKHKFAYSETDLATLAAAFAFGLASSRGFVDGKKRSAFAVAAVFLALNGFDLEAPEPEVVDVMNRVATSAMTEAALAAWMRTRVRPSR